MKPPASDSEFKEGPKVQGKLKKTYAFTSTPGAFFFRALVWSLPDLLNLRVFVVGLLEVISFGC